MKTSIKFLSLFALAAILVGCKPAAEETAVTGGGSAGGSDEPIIMDEMPPTMDDVHDHPDHGPHGGELVELGKETFHAELVHGDAGISIYVLDATAMKTVAIPSEKLVVSLKHDGQVASFDLVANPDANDPAGQTSRFTSTETKLDEWLHAGAEGAVVIEIEGKSYTGEIAHDHGHHGHKH